ncbi:hypothetical protein GMST_23070 [Geomonas silvestris]|uniref:Uncharacterized protein n=1 Tax=Geomonas silvestris TaxID=2740184 RepID=A0A6V8MJ58_9BACT|nr:hypothetical protein GMST_23070 [Geomonas silvestris]
MGVDAPLPDNALHQPEVEFIVVNKKDRIYSHGYSVFVSTLPTGSGTCRDTGNRDVVSPDIVFTVEREHRVHYRAGAVSAGNNGKFVAEAASKSTHSVAFSPM